MQLARIIGALFLLGITQAQAAPWGAETATVFDNLTLDEVGLTGYGGYAGDIYNQYPLYSSNAEGWNTWCMNWQSYSGPRTNCGHMNILVNGLNRLDGRNGLRPWIRILGWDHDTNCEEADETDLGNGWCRKAYDPATITFSHVADLAEDCIYYDLYSCDSPVPGGYMDDWDGFHVDNLIVEYIGNNVSIDFDPWSDTNIIRPDNSYFITVQVKTTSVSAGESFDFDATSIDPATLRLGPNHARVSAQVLAGDSDDDGDTDYTFGFRMEDTGLDCFDTSIFISGNTYSGDPIAGIDTIVPIDCEDAIAIDMDPYNESDFIRPNDNYNLSLVIFGQRLADGDATNLYPERHFQQNGLGEPKDIRIGPAQSPYNAGSATVSDVDGDSHKDLTVSFNVFDAGIACEDERLEVRALNSEEHPLLGSDAIVTQDCDTGCHPE